MTTTEFIEFTAKLVHKRKRRREKLKEYLRKARWTLDPPLALGRHEQLGEQSLQHHMMDAGAEWYIQAYILPLENKLSAAGVILENSYTTLAELRDEIAAEATEDLSMIDPEGGEEPEASDSER